MSFERTPVRVTMRAADGRELLRYLPGTRDGRPWADDAELLGPAGETIERIGQQLPGWLVSVTPEFGRELLGHGASMHRHASTMRLSLTPDLVSPGAPDGLRFVACDRPAAAIQPAVTAAFPPQHVDHQMEPEPDLVPAGETELEQLLSGELVGPLLPCSQLVADSRDAVVAGCLVNEWSPMPWITLMFRHPDRSPAGLGALLLASVAARAGSDGIASLGLAVTEGNPAKRVYQRAGFLTTSESMTVLIGG